MDYTTNDDSKESGVDDTTVSSGTGRTLSPAHVKELAASGITEAIARAAGVYSCDDQAELARLLGRKSCRFGDSIVYPFVGPDGKQTDYVRVKPGTPPTDPKKVGKAKKYIAPTGKPSRLYITPGALSVLNDPSVPIILTEGTKQALSADAHGYPCVAVSGVWCGFDKRKKDRNGRPIGPRVLIDDLQRIALKGRVVYLAFDSDAMTKKEVKAALKAMAKALAAKGAMVQVVRLPDGADGSKQGIDDFLARNGAGELKKLVDRASKSDDDEEADTRQSAADILVAIATTESVLWHDDSGTAFATVGRLSLPVRSKPYRQWLTNLYRKKCGGKVPNAEALSNAANAVEAAALFDGPRMTAHVRIAGHDGKVFVYLADDANTVIEIGPDGWQELPDPPVRFRHSPTALALPRPTRGGSLAPLRELLNVADDDTNALLMGWLVSVFLSDGPYPVLVLSGEQGAAKTTTVRVLKALTDPNAAPTRSEPKEVRDLMIATRGSRVLAFDNLSHLPAWLSDAFCVLSTGGGFSTRELFTDDGEVVFTAKRPVVTTSIEDLTTRSDLVDRAVVLRLRAIPESKRVAESEFWKRFEAMRPAVLGAVFDRVSAGLKALPAVTLTTLPRMADFARWAVACEKGAGEEAKFISAYERNQSAAQELPLEDSVIVAPLLKLAEKHADGWSGTASVLLKALESTDDKLDTKSREWPKKPNILTGKLRRLAPNLRKVFKLSIDLDGRSADKKRTRIITITSTPDKEVKTSSAPSASSGVGKNPTESVFWADDEPVGKPSAIASASSAKPTGRSPDGTGRSPDDEVPAQKHTNSRLSDGADGADDVSRSTTGTVTKAKLSYKSNAHRGTDLDKSGGVS